MEYSREKEFQVISDILSGNRDQYSVLVEKYSAMVFSIVSRFVNRRPEKEELAQQIFVKAYERLDSFNRNSKFSSWLYRLARNHCLDYAKNVRRNNKDFSEMDARELENKMRVDNPPDREIESKEWEEVLKEALSQIKPLYAEAFLMKYRDNMTYKAMAKRLDANESALKVRVHRARKELKVFIKNYS